MADDFVIVVTGGHKYKDRQAVFDRLDLVLSVYGVAPSQVLLYEGGAKGADRFAREWAQARGVRFKTVEAKWELGIYAGTLRNTEMLARAAVPNIVVQFPGGSGTADCVAKAKKLGYHVPPFNEHPKKKAGLLW
jgi:hypothetical protein